MATVLCLERDALQLDLLASVLKHDHHQLLGVGTSEDAFTILGSKVVDLIIVEPSRQRQESDRLCQQFCRINPDIPVLVLSERREEEQIVRTFQAGADDYVTKPFSPYQLLARIQALLRRSNRGRERRQDEILSIGEIELNLIQMQVVVYGKRVPLTPRELWLLHALMKNAGRVLSRDQLMRLAWGEQFIGVSKTVDVCIQRVRKKIAPHLPAGCIHALRGFGYKFQVDTADARLSGVFHSAVPASNQPLTALAE